MKLFILFSVALTQLFTSINGFRMQTLRANSMLTSTISRKIASSTSLQMASDAVPHGGKLVNTMVTSKSDLEKAIKSCQYEVELDERQLCDVELLMQG